MTNNKQKGIDKLLLDELAKPWDTEYNPTNNKQTYKPHDKTISPFSDFIINSTDEEKKRIFEVACELANQDQRNMIERANNKQTWREKMYKELYKYKVDCSHCLKGGYDGNEKVCRYCDGGEYVIPEDIEQFIEKTLQEQREETIELIKMESSNYTGYITQMSSLKSFDTGNIIRKFKDTLLKQLKK